VSPIRTHWQAFTCQDSPRDFRGLSLGLDRLRLPLANHPHLPPLYVSKNPQGF
jgi:hypothetical protein